MTQQDWPMVIQQVLKFLLQALSLCLLWNLMMALSWPHATWISFSETDLLWEVGLNYWYQKYFLQTLVTKNNEILPFAATRIDTDYHTE